MATEVKKGLVGRAKLSKLIWTLRFSKQGRKPRVFNRCADESDLNLVVRSFIFLSGRFVRVKLQAPAMVDFLKALRDTDGRTIDVTATFSSPYSGSFRIHAQQKALYDAYKAGEGSLAAPPCTSWHEAGLATDLKEPTDRERAAMERHGFKGYLPNDPPHFSNHVDTATNETF